MLQLPKVHQNAVCLIRLNSGEHCVYGYVTPSHMFALIGPNDARVVCTPCLKNCANLFMSKLRQISTNFDNFWQKHDKEATIM